MKQEDFQKKDGFQSFHHTPNELPHRRILLPGEIVLFAYHFLADEPSSAFYKLYLNWIYSNGRLYLRGDS